MGIALTPVALQRVRADQGSEAERIWLRRHCFKPAFGGVSGKANLTEG